MYYLTEEDYLRAEKNGISRKNVYNRHYILGWSVERAVTEPMNTHKTRWADYKSACEKVGLSRSGFFHRISKGMDPETASTTPPVAKGEFLQERNWKLSKKHYAIAEANGIKRGAVVSRVYLYGWSVEDAITLKTGKSKRKSRNKGDVFRTHVEVLKANNGVPTNIEFAGQKYELVHQESRN